MPKAKLPGKEFEWSPELAYAIGLLTTDGNLSGDGRHMTMRSCDVQLLKTFKKCLNLSNKISETFNNGWASKRAYRVQFGNVQFYRWLVKIGLSPRKTYTLGELKIPDKYFPDFLRGHLDGDGSINTYMDRYNTYRGRTYTNQRIFIRFTSASNNHISWLYRKINQNNGAKGAFIYKPPATPNCVPMWDIKFAKKESIKLLKWIYYKENLPCLKRKRIIAEKAIEKISKEKRKKYTKIKI
ncbi:MAG: hypothetical protein QME61_02720 [Patescibacteria group bacterium]|nr:hypothetical protein [Patescibacteria group bacterium]